MFHRIRSLHRWLGVGASLCLLILSVTGFLLATKSSLDWIRPMERKGVKIAHLGEATTVQIVAEAAFAVGLSELRVLEDIDRIDYRPKDNIFKVLSRQGYHEVQVDGKTGKVLNVARRNDHFVEAIHDFSWFTKPAKTYGLPLVATALFVLAATGVGIFFVPIVRRARFRKRNR